MANEIIPAFTGVPTIDKYENVKEKIECLQIQITSMKRDLEYLLFNIDTTNLTKRLQKLILESKEEE